MITQQAPPKCGRGATRKKMISNAKYNHATGYVTFECADPNILPSDLSALNLPRITSMGGNLYRCVDWYYHQSVKSLNK